MMAAKKRGRPAFEEEDDGFLFTRTRKKAKAQGPTATATATTAPRRRSARHSGRAPEPVEQLDGRGAEKAAAEKRTRRKRLTATPPPPAPPPAPEPVRADAATATARDTATTIALAFSDTPIIKRNKELRQRQSTGRRSSIGLRGRRASSLIDSGSSALPHDEVAVADFYKHIAADGLPEPRRMKQLLTWCGTRALAEKPSFSADDGSARLAGERAVQTSPRDADVAARVIQEELLRDVSNRSEMSDWFSRVGGTPLARRC